LTRIEDRITISYNTHLMTPRSPSGCEVISLQKVDSLLVFSKAKTS